MKTKTKTSVWTARISGAILSLLLLLSASSSVFAADGAKLFKENCATCHKVDKDMTGPALYKAENRISGGRDWIYGWVQNSPGMIAAGDEYAKEVYEKWNKVQMTAFPSFTNEDIDAILDYVAEEGARLEAGTGGVGPSGGVNLEDDEKVFGLWNWVRFLIFLVVLLLGNIALQIARLRGVELLKGVDLNKLNSRLWLGFMVFGLIAAAWSSIAFKDTYIHWESASVHGEEIDRMFWITMIVALIVFVFTNILLMYFAYKYRHDDNRKAKYYPENGKLELLWTVVPAIVLTILVVFGIRTWTNVMVNDPPADAYEVELNAQQFAWNLRYPGVDGEFGDINLHLISGNNLLGVNYAQPVSHDDFMANELYLPKGKPVILRIRSRDVLHSVHMPHFRVKMDAVPGMPTRFTFTPKYTTQEWRDRTGNQEFEFELACAEVCGRSHFSMKRIIKVVEEEDYIKWVKEQKPMFDPAMTYKGIDMDVIERTADASRVE